MEKQQSIGVWMRVQRALKGETRAAAARSIEVSGRTLYLWESEQRRPTKPEHIEGIARWAGVGVVDVFQLILGIAAE